MSWQTPKTNWTSVDTYLANDLNRVESNTQYIATVLAMQGYTVPTLSYKLNWTQEDILVSDDFNRIESNIKSLADYYYTGSEWQELKTNWVALDSVDYTFANRIEKNLKILKDILDTMIRHYIRFGVGNLGQNRIYQQRWR